MFSMRVIIPANLFGDAAKLDKALENALEESAKAVKVDFDVTTQTWKQRPEFTITRTSGSRIVATTDEIYGYVDEGTRPHVIRPRQASILRFQQPFRAKTRPRSIRSGAGFLGKKVVWAHETHHPGTAPRFFAETIAKKWDRQFPIQIQRALDALSF